MGRMEAFPPHTLAQPGELGQPSFLGLLTPHPPAVLFPAKRKGK